MILKFMAIVLLVTCGYLVIDGYLTGAVWVKGSESNKLVDFNQWAHKRSKKDSPNYYWLAMAYYTGALLFASYLVLFKMILTEW